ncbi:MAG: SDR family oxidoreductase [Mycobacterium sp.]|uniref:SDR family oxidoreductase n=1 Tax=Mycobacterium sp. TaxID=1785 RepID=UPI003BB78428
MRLPYLPPAGLSAEQKSLYDDMAAVIETNFGELVARGSDGALIGPFNGWLHFPQFGKPAWDFNKSLWEHSVLPAAIHQLVILVTAAKLGARYEIYGHEYFARRAGLAERKIATIAAGERPSTLTRDEGVAYDMAAALNRGGPLPESTYRTALETFGEHGLAEIVFLVGCFSMVGVTLNAFDASVPRPDGARSLENGPRVGAPAQTDDPRRDAPDPASQRSRLPTDVSEPEAPRVAIITGASQGIGAGLVTAYRQRGFRVVANSRSLTPGPDPDTVAVAADIADPAVCAQLVSTAVETFGRVDTVVNNAGIFIGKPFTDYTAEDYAAACAVNMSGFFWLTQRAISQMLSQNTGGHIVSITTTLVEQASHDVPAALAALTKGGVAAATKSLAIEYARNGIRVNAVSPGTIATPMHPPDTHERLAALQPLGRMGSIADVVDGVLYLESASFVTGEFLHVDGGQSAGH